MNKIVLTGVFITLVLVKSLALADKISLADSFFNTNCSTFSNVKLIEKCMVNELVNENCKNLKNKAKARMCKKKAKRKVRRFIKSSEIEDELLYESY